MGTMLLIIAGTIIVTVSVCGYIKALLVVKRDKQKIMAAEAKLKEVNDNEQRLKDEVSLLQNKLNNTFTDPVTHLLSWQLFEDRLNQNIKESERYRFTLGVLFVDIDEFKVINNALGYEAGDELLNEVAIRLQGCIRQVDSITRFTKDTFVIILTQLAKPETAVIVAQRILQVLAEAMKIKDQVQYVTACIGVAIYPTDAKDAQSLLRNADHALHLAKAKGKHLYQFYQEKLHEKSQRELALYNDLNRESIFAELVLYFQPIVDVKTETVVCLDALLYWQHPQLGLIEPKELFHYAEKQRKLNAITEWLLQKICQQYLHWQSLGFCPQLIGIPVSFKQLENSHFIYRISQILQEQSFKAERVLLEIKDSTAQIPFDALEKSFNMLKFIGVNIAMDDFGVGGLALSNLKDFPINYLRFDPKLIEDVHANQQAVNLIKSLVYLANNLSMQVIVQGVDSTLQVEILQGLGCRLMQGQLLGPPLKEAEVGGKMGTTQT